MRSDDRSDAPAEMDSGLTSQGSIQDGGMFLSESAWDIKCRVLLSLNVIESYLGTESLSSEVVSESNFVYVFGSDKVREAVFIKGNNPVRFLFCCKGSRTYRIVPRETSI